MGQNWILTGQCQFIKNAARDLNLALNSSVRVSVSGQTCELNISGGLPAFVSLGQNGDQMESNCFGFSLATAGVIPYPTFLASSSPFFKEPFCKPARRPEPGDIGLISPQGQANLIEHAFFYISDELRVSKPNQGSSIQVESGSRIGGPELYYDHHDIRYVRCNRLEKVASTPFEKVAVKAFTEFFRLFFLYLTNPKLKSEEVYIALARAKEAVRGSKDQCSICTVLSNQLVTSEDTLSNYKQVREHPEPSVVH